MDDPTIGQPSEEPNGDQRSGFTRRQVGIGAAWALPVIAAATAAPMAAASLDDVDSSLSVVSGSEISVSSNTAGGTVTGSFGGNATITNAGNGSSVDFAEAIYQLEGPIDLQFMKFGATTLTTGSPTTITDGLYTWSVNAFNNYVILTLQTLPIAVPGGGVSTVINVPVLSYANTLTATAVLPPPPGQQVRASLSFTVKDSTQGQLQDGNFKLYPSA